MFIRIFVLVERTSSCPLWLIKTILNPTSFPFTRVSIKQKYRKVKLICWTHTDTQQGLAEAETGGIWRGTSHMEAVWPICRGIWVTQLMNILSFLISRSWSSIKRGGVCLAKLKAQLMGVWGLRRSYTRTSKHHSLKSKQLGQTLIVFHRFWIYTRNLKITLRKDILVTTNHHLMYLSLQFYICSQKVSIANRY